MKKYIRWWDCESYDDDTGVSVTHWVNSPERMGTIRYWILCWTSEKGEGDYVSIKQYVGSDGSYVPENSKILKAMEVLKL